MSVLDIKVETAVCLAFDIEKADTLSGFRPAEFHLGSDEPLMAQSRLRGYAAALTLGFAQRAIIAGKDERRYKNDTVEIDGRQQPLWQGWAICRMLEHDYGIAPTRLQWIPSDGTTEDAIKAFQKAGCFCGDYAVLSSWYHLTRASLWLDSITPPVRRYSAESFILAACSSEAEREQRLQEIREEYERGLVRRAMKEIVGIERHLCGTYERQTKGW